MPANYKGVLDTLAKQGDFKDNVLKVNIPHNDLKVTVNGVATPTPFGFGGWVALTKGTGGMNVLMGDLVLTQDEVNPVMSALLEQGLDVTALHNHFFWESPRIFYMHVHGHGTSADLAKKLKPAIDLIGKAPARAETPAGFERDRRHDGYDETRQHHRRCRRPERPGLQDHAAAPRHQAHRDGGGDQFADGPQHLDGIFRQRCVSSGGR